MLGRALNQLSAALAILILLLLSACFSSESPLLGAGDTPLPASFKLVQVKSDGEIIVDGKREVEVSEYKQRGLSYVSVRDAGAYTITVRMFDSPTALYALQLELTLPNEQNKKIIYGFLVRNGNRIKVFFPEPKIEGAVKAANVPYTSRPDHTMFFSTREQLYDALRVFSSHLSDGDVGQFRMASTPDEVDRLNNDIAVAKNRPPAIVASAPPVVAAPPTAQQQLLGVPVSPTAALQQDAGADVPNSCDQQAASNTDPNRMALGVSMSSIVPRLAQQECEKAVSQFPHTARFKYQLGRAQAAANNFAAANSNYQIAALAGYPAAFYNLGIAYIDGTGVSPDAAMAEQLLRKALAGGVNAQGALQGLVFNSDGYSSPQVFQAVYDGRLSAETAKGQSVYWAAFLDLYNNTPDCSRVVSRITYGKFNIAGQMGVVTGMLGAMSGANRNYRPGDFGAAAQSGWNAGMGFNNGMITNLSKAKEDAQLFYDRHGCDSAVAIRFFKNIADIASQL